MTKGRLQTLKPRLAEVKGRELKQVNPDSWRSGKTTAERGYDGRWQKARETFLNHHPLCAYCERDGRVTAATVVDHKTPHRGDQDLFWNRDNWQPLCASCHSSFKQQLEKSGATQGCDAAGMPMDPGHHWSI
jgi:hypothetical protein